MVFLGVTGGEIGLILISSLIGNGFIFGLLSLLFGEALIIAIGLPISVLVSFFVLSNLIENTKRGRHEDYFTDYYKVTVSRRLRINLIETFSGKWEIGR